LTHPPHLSNPLARCLAACVEPAYSGVMSLRNMAYDCGFARTHRAHVPVISVGNLTAGGTGKTPVVIDVARRLKSFGANPAIILRGYRADSAGQSDEAMVYEQALPFVPVAVDSDRVAAAQRVRCEHPQVDVIVLDDAFQHRRIARNLDLVLIDATCPFGYDAVLPRGLLRETPTGLRRADAVIVTRCDHVDERTLTQINQRIETLTDRPPIAHAMHAWDGFVDQHDKRIEPDARRVAVVCGIGNPDAFIRQAGRQFDIVERRVFGDHHHYTTDDLTGLGDANAVVTTDKDWVKLRDVLESSTLDVPIIRPRLVIRYADGEQALTRWVQQTYEATD